MSNRNKQNKAILGRHGRHPSDLCIGAWDETHFSLNRVVDIGITAKLRNLVSESDNLPGPGHMTETTADGRKSKYALPATDRAVRSQIHARLGNAMVIVGGAFLRLHTSNDQEHLYGVNFGRKAKQC